MRASVIMIETAGEPFAFVDREIEFKLVTRARARIWPDRMAAVVKVRRAVPSRKHARRAVEEPRELVQCDRSLVVEAARRATFSQKLRERRERPGVRQIDFLSGPAGPQRRQRRNDADVGVSSAQRIGVSAFRAAGMEQKIVKFPKSEIAVALGGPRTFSVARFQQDLAIREQSEKRHSRKPVLPSQTLDLLGPGQHGQGCCDPRIVYFEQSAGARRFQNQFVAAPSHISEPRQDKRVRCGERPRFGPIIGSLRFYDDEILAAARGAEAEL